MANPNKLDIKELNNILLQHFPCVLNYIILEYITSVEHEFIKTETIKYSFPTQSPYYCADNEYIYTFIHGHIEKSKLVSEDKHYVAISPHDSICLYDGNIYVALRNHIKVFNNNCIAVRTIPFYYEEIIHIKCDRIFGSNNRMKFIQITDLYGKYINQINISDEFYSMRTCDNYLYVLTHSEIIYKYSFDGNLIEKYDKLYGTHIKILDFSVIDCKIYDMIKRQIFDFELYDVCGTNYAIIKERSVKCVHYNNMLHISSYEDVFTYNIVKKTLHSLIYKK